MTGTKDRPDIIARAIDLAEQGDLAYCYVRYAGVASFHRGRANTGRRGLPSRKFFFTESTLMSDFISAAAAQGQIRFVEFPGEEGVAPNADEVLVACSESRVVL